MAQRLGIAAVLSRGPLRDRRGPAVPSPCDRVSRGAERWVLPTAAHLVMLIENRMVRQWGNLTTSLPVALTMAHLADQGSR
jgi:hypothetical protein